MSEYLDVHGTDTLLKHIRDGFDASGKQKFNSLFGDLITVERQSDIEVQFQYNISTIDTTATIVGSGTVTQANNMAVLQTGTDSNGSAQLESSKVIRYRPGFEGYAYFTAIFSTPVADSSQHIGAFTTNDGYYIGYTGTDFVVGRRYNGTSTEVSSGDFNGNADLSRIDFTKMNIFRVTWGWLGTAGITFQIKMPEKWVVLHQMLLEGTLTQPHSSNPVLPICAYIENDGNTSNLTLKSASWNGGMMGIDRRVGNRYFTGATSGTVTTEAVLINFQNVSTFQSKGNRTVAEGVKVSMSSDGNKPAIIKIYKNLAITSPTWADVDSTNSIMQTDTVGTVTPNDANLLMEYNLARSDSLLDDLRDMDFIIKPGETITITGQSSVSNDLTFTARWREWF